MKLKRKFLFAHILLFNCILLVAAQSGTQTFLINDWTMKIDETTGGMVELSRSGFGAILQAPVEKAGLITASYPLQIFQYLQLEPRFSTGASISESGGKVTISWNFLGPSRVGAPIGQVKARVEIEGAADGKSLIFKGHIENTATSANQVYQILFPDFQGIRAFDDDNLFDLRMSSQTVKPFKGSVLPAHRAPFYAPWLWQRYPVTTSTRWLFLESPVGSIKISQNNHMADPVSEIMTHRDEGEPSYLRLLWRNPTRVDPGETWDSGEFWITPQ